MAAGSARHKQTRENLKQGKIAQKAGVLRKIRQKEGGKKGVRQRGQIGSAVSAAGVIVKIIRIETKADCESTKI